MSAFADREPDSNDIPLPLDEGRNLASATHSVGIYSHAFFLTLFCLLLAPVHAQTPTIDRAAVYQKALPSYQYDTSKPLAVKLGAVQKIGDAQFLRFSYLSTNGQRVPALLFSPTRPIGVKNYRDMPAMPCLVILHGLGGSKEIMSGMALAAAKMGYASLVIDEYGQGDRGPLKTVPGQQAQELATTVLQTTVDVRRGLDYLATRGEIDSKRIGLVGVSLGAIIGTVVSGVDTRIKATVLVSGGGDWGLILKTLSAHNATVSGHSTSAFKNINWASLSVLLAPEDPLTFAPHIAPRPLLMLGGRKDTTIVPQAQQELFDATNDPKQIVWYPQYGHVPPPEVVYPAMQKFFGKKL
ncbi:MAG: alpha/beta hydrolase [Janthinobacterium lividum]